MVVGFISVTVHICDSGNVHQILLFRYFREELKQREMGKGLVPGRPHSILLSYNSEKAMAPHSSTLAWKIRWTEEPGRLQPMGSLRVGHD